MARELQISKILVYYDVPQVFIGKDNVGVKFLCLLTDYEVESPEYICIPISSTRYQELITGKIDLRTAFVEPEIRDYYSLDNFDGGKAEAKLLSVNSLEESQLPEEGFFLEFDESKVSEEIFIDASNFNNSVVQLSISNGTSTGIGLSVLGEIASSYQALIKNLYKRELKSLRPTERVQFQGEGNYQLYAHRGSPGSFTLHLHSKSERDLFNNNFMERILGRVDSLIVDSVDEDVLIEAMRLAQGHSLTSYKTLLGKIKDLGLSLSYNWYSPNLEEERRKIISVEYATQVYELLIKAEELTQVEKVFIGYFTKIDVPNGTWRIHNEEDGKEYKGESDDDLLKGITLTDVRYKLKCLEIIEEKTVSEKETTKYQAVEISQES